MFLKKKKLLPEFGAPDVSHTPIRPATLDKSPFSKQFSSTNGRSARRLHPDLSRPHRHKPRALIHDAGSSPSSAAGLHPTQAGSCAPASSWQVEEASLHRSRVFVQGAASRKPSQGERARPGLGRFIHGSAAPSLPLDSLPSGS